MNRVELIVLDFDGGQDLIACLESISLQSELPRRLILFDNGSSTPLSDRMKDRSWPFETTIVREERNTGFTGGINRSMNAIRAPYVGWINNDVVLDREWLTTLRAALDADDRLGAVQSIIRGSTAVDGAGIDISSGSFRQLGHGQTIGEFDSREAWGVSGTATMFRTDALRESAVSGFVLHPAFFAYYEDVELSARLHKRGWKTAVVPLPLASHRGSASAGKLGVFGDRLRVRNRYFVNRMHPEAGRRFSLISEDARRILRLLFAAKFGSAWRTAVAVLEGLTAAVIAREG